MAPALPVAVVFFLMLPFYVCRTSAAYGYQAQSSADRKALYFVMVCLEGLQGNTFLQVACRRSLLCLVSLHAV